MLKELLLLGIASIASVTNQSAMSNKCYHAKTCIHNGKEECGRDERGKPRRFLDSCDMKEYNCLKKAEYIQTIAAKCQELPSIENTMPLHHAHDDENDKNDNENESNEMIESEHGKNASDAYETGRLDEEVDRESEEKLKSLIAEDEANSRETGNQQGKKE